ncbi:MAG TPA: O-antigen ligase family protein [Chitinophagaceae bacterium]|nr:O-antigen ligase family protein [Chitinophagaceae bacterium]
MSRKKQRKPAAQNRQADPVRPNKEKPFPAQAPSPMTHWMMVAAALIPFILSLDTMDSNLVPRYLFFGIFILVFLVFFYVLRKQVLPVISFPVKLLLILGAAFTAWSMIVAATAINPAETIYEISRYALNLIFLFLVMVMIMREEGRVLLLCKTIVIVAILQSLVGILQYYDLAFASLPGNFKPYGLAANRNLFGSFQTVLLPFVLFSFYKSGRAWKISSALAFVLLAIALLLSQTRSAWLAALAIILVSFLLVFIFSPANRKKWSLASIAALSLFFLIGLLMVGSDRNGELSQSIRERAGSLTGSNAGSSIATGNIRERFRIWGKTVELIKNKPLSGVGQGNWKIAIPAYGTEGLVWAQGNYVPDRAHNIYLQVAAETGIPGALFYFAGWLIIAFMGLGVVRGPGPEERRILVIFMLAGLAGFAIDAFFSFPTERIEHSVYMLLMCGIIAGAYQNSRREGKETGTFSFSTGVIAVALAITAFNIFMAIKKYNFETHAVKAKNFENSGAYDAVISEVEAGKTALVTLDPNGSPLEMMSGSAYKELKDPGKALEELALAKKYNPNSSRIHNNIGTVYTDMNDFHKAIPAYEKALTLTPGYEIIYKNLAVNYFQVGNDSGCIASLKKVNLANDEYLAGLLQEAERRQAAKKPR